jgi:CopG family transcriptional regulator / antitoxin EndoAI
MCIIPDMKKAVHVRINITLPEETIAMLDTVAGKGRRSAFIDTAIRKQVRDIRKNSLRERLKAGAIARGDRDLAMADDWFSIEEELWQE